MGDRMNLPLLKLDMGSVVLGIFAIILLLSGWPFSNPMTSEDLWQWIWKGILWITLLGALVSTAKIVSEKYL